MGWLDWLVTGREEPAEASTEVVQRIAALLEGIVKTGKHEALADIHESIGELKYYREHFIKL